MSGAAPAVTVVVPTHNRREFLPELVDALRAQSRSDFRAVFVDDGSTDGTVDAARAAFGDDERFQIVSITNGGPSAARNVGGLDATTEWIAFTDDDCIPRPGWLEALLSAAESTGATVVEGRTISDPRVDMRAEPWFSRGKTVTSWSGAFQTCNLLVRSEDLRSVDGFDESFSPDVFGEDRDLGVRLVAAGAATTFAPDALVHHRVMRQTYRGYLKRRYRHGQFVQVVATNPAVRSTFSGPYWFRRLHLVVLVATVVSVGALARRQWWVPAVGVGAFVVGRVRETKGEGRSTTVRTARAPLELVGMMAEVAGLVVESVRHRTVLL